MFLPHMHALKDWVLIGVPRVSMYHHIFSNFHYLPTNLRLKMVVLMEFRERRGYEDYVI